MVSRDESARLKAGLLIGAALLTGAVAQPPASDNGIPVMRFAEPEVSGLAPSVRYPGVFWAIQDSGPEPRNVLLAVRIAGGVARPWPDGQWVRTVPVRGAVNHDWEEVTVDGRGHLWIADIGNNRGLRGDLALLELEEPDPWRDAEARLIRRLPLRYPDAPATGRSWNAEALFFRGDEGWLIAKAEGHPLYRLPMKEATVSGVLAVREGALTPPEGGFGGLVTGAALAADGRSVAIAAGRRRLWLYDVRPEVSLSDALRSAPPNCALVPGHDDRPWQIEAVCFVPGSHHVLAAAEEGPVWFWTSPCSSR